MKFRNRVLFAFTSSLLSIGAYAADPIITAYPNSSMHPVEISATTAKVKLAARVSYEKDACNQYTLEGQLSTVRPVGAKNAVKPSQYLYEARIGQTKMACADQTTTQAELLSPSFTITLGNKVGNTYYGTVIVPSDVELVVAPAKTNCEP